VRRRNWKVPDLYVGNSSSIYWFAFGLNWRAFLGWTLGIWPSFRKPTFTYSRLYANTSKAGFVQAISGRKLAPGWLKCFQAAWFIGFLGGGLVYYVICLISPPPGRPYVRELFGNEHNEVIDGMADSGPDTASDPEKSRVAASSKDV
jgi:nucleobase:cation symporter-1, NCS1 family